MQQQKGVYYLLTNIEITLEDGFPIIPRVFTIINSKKLSPMIDQLYTTIPNELQEARKFLKSREDINFEENNIALTPAKTNNSTQSVYDLILQLELTIERGSLPIVPGLFSIVYIAKINSLIEKIYEAIPPEIQKVRAYLRHHSDEQRNLH